MPKQMTSSEADELGALVTNAKNHFAIGAYDRGIEIMDDVQDSIALGYVKLPTDSDGVTIRIGDVLYEACGEPIDDWLLECDEYGWRVVTGEGRAIQPYETSHRKPVTVTDLLRDFNVQASKCDNPSALNALIEKYESEIIKIARREIRR